MQGGESPDLLSNVQIASKTEGYRRHPYIYLRLIERTVIEHITVVREKSTQQRFFPIGASLFRNSRDAGAVARCTKLEVVTTPHSWRLIIVVPPAWAASAYVWTICLQRERRPSCLRTYDYTGSWPRIVTMYLVTSDITLD